MQSFTYIDSCLSHLCPFSTSGTNLTMAITLLEFQNTPPSISRNIDQPPLRFFPGKDPGRTAPHHGHKIPAKLRRASAFAGTIQINHTIIVKMDHKDMYNKKYI